MKSLIRFFKAVRDAFDSPNLPMDSDYSYRARRLEAERLQRARRLRTMGY
jgi:hypothetical protein